MGTTPAILGASLGAAALAALGLTLLASVRRRRRDLAALKILGFTRSQLSAVVAWQVERGRGYRNGRGYPSRHCPRSDALGPLCPRDQCSPLPGCPRCPDSPDRTRCSGARPMSWPPFRGVLLPGLQRRCFCEPNEVIAFVSQMIMPPERRVVGGQSQRPRLRPVTSAAIQRIFCWTTLRSSPRRSCRCPAVGRPSRPQGRHSRDGPRSSHLGHPPSAATSGQPRTSTRPACPATPHHVGGHPLLDLRFGRARRTSLLSHSPPHVPQGSRCGSLSCGRDRRVRPLLAQSTK